MRRSLPLIALLSIGSVQAEMVAMQDEEMSEVQGAGIGFVLDNILLDASQSNITINDITNGSGQNVPISVKEFYLGATGSNKGATLNPVTIGRLNHPFALNLAKGESLRSFVNGAWVQTTPNNVAVLELTFPERLLAAAGGQPCLTGGTSTCSSRTSERFDLGVRFDFQVAAGRTDILNIDLAEVTMDGSYLRLWGDSVRSQMVGEARVNVFAKTLEIMSCAVGGTNCTSSALQNERTIYATDFVGSVALGYGKTQPLLFDVLSTGQFVLELPNPVKDPANPTANVDTTTGVGKARADDFYANAPRTNISIGNLNAGGTRASYAAIPTGGYNFGANEINGLGFNYLKVTSHDL